jgi:molybdate transport system substrate-binding protein
MAIYIRLLIAFIGCFAAGCGGVPPPKQADGARESIRVAAASDLQNVLPALAARFTASSSIEVVPIFGASGQLAQQIRQGAPFDVFLSANEEFVRNLSSAGHIKADSVNVYAQGRLLLAVHSASKVTVNGLTDLTNSNVKRIAIANPELAPYGLAARQALEKSGLWDRLKPKIVQAETVRQAFQYVETGNAEAGLVAHSVRRIDGVQYHEVDIGLHEPIVQALGVIADTKHDAASRRFTGFILSDEGRKQLASSGFGPAPDRKGGDQGIRRKDPK